MLRGIQRLTFAFSLALSVAAAPSAVAPASEPASEIPVEEWLREPDRQDFALKLQVKGPDLSFELRHLITVVARLEARDLQRKHVQRELHYVMKVADEGGNWFTGDSTGNMSLTAKLGSGDAIEFVGSGYFRPGEYTIAFVVYDAIFKERSVALRRVRIPVPKNDPIPELNQRLPRVEFLLQPEVAAAHLGLFRDVLFLRSTRAVHIDLIVDFGAYSEYLGSTRAKFYATRLLQTASLLSQIRPTYGCVEVTAVDILRTEVLFRRRKAAEVDWPAVREQVLGRNLEVVDANVLAARRETASLFADFLGSLVKEPATCGEPNGSPLKVVLLVASGVEFPLKTRVEPIPPACNCVIYYLRQVQHPYAYFDDMPRLLKHLRAHETKITDPKKFRWQLAELLASLEATSKTQ